MAAQPALNFLEKKATVVVSAATPMMTQYGEIKQHYKDCLLFFRMGDFYEMFFEDAVIAAHDLDIALTKRGKQGEVDIPMCGVPFHAYESYLAKLIMKGHKVAICEQLEDPETARKRGAKGPLRRDVIRVVTPGTLTEEALLSARRNNFLIGLSPLQRGEIAIASLDLSTGAFFVEKSTMLLLPSVLARLQPAEILLPESLLQQPDLFEVFMPFKKILCPLPAARFDQQNCERAVLEAYNVKTVDAFGNFSGPEMIALGIVIDYTKLCHKAALNLLAPPQQQLATQFMIIDAATQRSLELTYTLGGQRQGSVLSVIDRTKTAAGGRLLARQLVAPLTDVAAINHRLDTVDFFVKANALRKTCAELLSHCPDMERALARIHLGRGSPRDLGVLRDGLIQARATKECLIAEAVALLPLQALGFFEGLIDRLQRALHTQLPPHTRDGGFIAQGYHEQLDHYRCLREDAQATLMQLQSRYVGETGITSLKIRHNHVVGYHIEIGAAHAAKVPPSFIHRQTMVSHMRYTTPELSDWERSIEAALHQTLALELQLFADLLADVQAHAREILDACHVLAHIDVAVALAILAVEEGYHRPLIDASQTFIIQGGRHPVVEAALQARQEGPFIKNDCVLDDNHKVILLTGPNMAGKSTYLRQNALLAILAQMGAFVPAASAHIGVIDRIFSRIGAADDLASGRSTFMVEMIETATILHQATSSSFVILDEIGRGTATYDGLSIAWAVIETLATKNHCRTLFATHYHELTQLAQSFATITNCTMQIHEWEEKIAFMHQVIPGCANRSYGLHVAALAGVPAAVIQRAEAILVTLEAKKDQTAVAMPLPTGKSEEPQVLKELRQLDVDNLSPRQALEALYQLKAGILT
jgi:DNA mismatch repair protein MutS